MAPVSPSLLVEIGGRVLFEPLLATDVRVARLVHCVGDQGAYQPAAAVVTSKGLQKR